MNKVYILLGANLGNPLEQIEQAKNSIDTTIGKIVTRSSLYETEAWGLEEQPPFFNQVILVETDMLAPDVLATCQEIENTLGRVRHKKWDTRIIDIDILYFNDECIHTPKLVVPHPYLHFRRFTLVPLCEIAPEYVHPQLFKTNQELLEASTDPLSVKKLDLT
ncbi:2-amino-4-hydroxy-6-hydroxymethyldihydropteridine diphosphokinase [Parapedobacter sp. SGR-10]|uniref:2-amino-4-hydroxy-6- hydroxymethyldihydropteridine diphosphokinase n=1 Tax=Parapedobacter sp. SGR-10 TaxID=2710879 RepID=UPI0013D0985D|nr:2-amino-4-hydroxy-6-hydroxymethyldihydropteridine diphosphokinase [Parapedobacter sp. SGR-10]NGF58090.1 2-amino-4-hydroxy-6-hydroxymethyldihydropteridine diphosphokinase [Parapedobacter sp. SGR-10]